MEEASSLEKNLAALSGSVKYSFEVYELKEKPLKLIWGFYPARFRSLGVGMEKTEKFAQGCNFIICA